MIETTPTTNRSRGAGVQTPGICPRCGRRPGALLSLREAAECLSVPAATLDYWVFRLRRIPKVSVGLPGQRGRARVRHQDLEALVHEERPLRAVREGGRGR